MRAVIERDSALSVSVSHTTRVRRESERDGVEYNFVDRATFEQMVAEGRCRHRRGVEHRASRTPVTKPAYSKTEAAPERVGPHPGMASAWRRGRLPA